MAAVPGALLGAGKKRDHGEKQTTRTVADGRGNAEVSLAQFQVHVPPVNHVGRVAGKDGVEVVIGFGYIGPGRIVIRFLKLEGCEADVVGADDRLDVGVIKAEPIDAGDGDGRVVNTSLRLNQNSVFEGI